MEVELKKELLGIAEKQLLLAIDQVEGLAKLLAARSDNTIDDIVVAGVGMLKPELKKLVDKLDGEVDLA